MRVGLDHHLIYFREAVEVGHVLPAVVAREGAQHLVGGDARALAFRRVYLDQPLRVADVERGVGHGDLRTLVQRAQILLRGLEEGVHVASRLVLHVQFEGVTHTVSGDHSR